MLYYYFDFSNTTNSSAENLFRSLVTQIAKQTPELPKALDRLSWGKFRDTRYGTRMRRQASLVAQPSMSELSDLLYSSMEEFDHVYIMLDALDECVERGKLLSVVQRLVSSKKNNLQVLVTSQSDADIVKQLAPVIATHVLIESSLIESDICSYIRDQLCNNLKLKKWPQKVQERVKSTLMTGSQGMYVRSD